MIRNVEVFTLRPRPTARSPASTSGWTSDSAPSAPVTFTRTGDVDLDADLTGSSDPAKLHRTGLTPLEACAAVRHRANLRRQGAYALGELGVTTYCLRAVRPVHELLPLRRRWAYHCLQADGKLGLAKATSVRVMSRGLRLALERRAHIIQRHRPDPVFVRFAEPASRLCGDTSFETSIARTADTRLQTRHGFWIGIVVSSLSEGKAKHRGLAQMTSRPPWNTDLVCCWSRPVSGRRRQWYVTGLRRGSNSCTGRQRAGSTW